MFFTKKNKNNNIQAVDNHSSFLETGWLTEDDAETEGQLAIDVYQTSKRIIIKSTIAGVNPEDLKISLHNDLLTVQGTRSPGKELGEGDYLYQECYWGSFSRSIILPAEVDPKNVEAELENGILTITLHKTKGTKIDVKVKD